MGGSKVQERFEINEELVEWLEEMAEKHDLPDRDKALRVALDYVVSEADVAQVFTEIRCLHC